MAAEPLTAPQELAVGWRKLCTVRAVGAAAERDATVYAPLLELDAGVESSIEGGVGGGGGICAARKLGGVSHPKRRQCITQSSDRLRGRCILFATGFGVRAGAYLASAYGC